MNKKTSKIFSIFWLVAGLAWLIALVKCLKAGDDIVGILIYAIAAVISFVLSFAYRKDFIK